MTSIRFFCFLQRILIKVHISAGAFSYADPVHVFQYMHGILIFLLIFPMNPRRFSSRVIGMKYSAQHTARPDASGQIRMYRHRTGRSHKTKRQYTRYTLLSIMHRNSPFQEKTEYRMETGSLKRLADKENLNLRVSLQMKDKMQKHKWEACNTFSSLRSLLVVSP